MRQELPNSAFAWYERISTFERAPHDSFEILDGALRAWSASMRNDPIFDELCSRIIACAIRVHDALGPGLLESIYRDCLMMELAAAGLTVESEVHVPIRYRGKTVRDDLRLDLLVNGWIIVEVKSVDRIHPVHLAQVMTYLKLADKPAGLLLNFNVTSLRIGLRRLDHPDIYAQKRSRMSSEV